MESCERQSDPWRWPTLLLWYLFLAIGVAPEYVFEQLRDTGDVVTQDALVNSPYIITIAYAAFLGAFAYFKCRACGEEERAAQNAGMNLGLVALMAFLPFPLSLFSNASRIPSAHLRHFVYGLGGVKMLAWVYLLIVFTLYYAFDRTVFSGKSRHRTQGGDSPCAARAELSPEEEKHPESSPSE